MKMPVISTETVSLLAPHIIDLVRGVFRSRKDKEVKAGSEEQALDILGKEIVELQEVASKHAAAIGEIAQRADARFSQIEKQLKRQRLLAWASLVIAVISAIVALMAWAK
jgi:hypothetical protein